MEWKWMWRTLRSGESQGNHSPVQIIIGEEKLENVNYSNYLSIMITNDARCTCEIKSKIAITKAAFNKEKEDSIHEQTGLQVRKKPGKCYIWSIAVYGAESWTLPEKSQNVVPEKDGGHQMDRSCEKWRSITKSQGGNEYPTYNKKNDG